MIDIGGLIQVYNANIDVPEENFSMTTFYRDTPCGHASLVISV